MCGLVGIIARKPGENLVSAFKAMLIADQVRGKDSTGAFLVRKDLSTFLYKELGTPDGVLGGGVDYTNSILLMGHNRAATKGAVSVANAHPFEHGDIILAHNGTLRGRDGLSKRHFTVDSEHIAHTISEDPKQMLEVIKNLNGAYCLTIYDRHKGEFYITRNKERPMYLYFSEQGIFYASLEWMLQIGVLTAGLEWDEGNLFELPIHTLYTFPLDGGKPRITKYEGKEWPDYGLFMGAGVGGGGGGDYNYYNDRSGIRTLIAKVSQVKIPYMKMEGADVIDITDANNPIALPHEFTMWERRGLLENSKFTGFCKVKTYRGGYNSKGKTVSVDTEGYESISEEEYFLLGGKQKSYKQEWIEIYSKFKTEFREPKIVKLPKGSPQNVELYGDLCMWCGHPVDTDVHAGYLVMEKSHKEDNLLFCSFECLKETV